MRRVAMIAVVLIAALAASAIAAGAASATKLTLTNEAGTALLPEEYIGFSGYNNIGFRTPVGAIECTEPGTGAGIAALQLTNAKSTDALEVYEVMNDLLRGNEHCAGEAGYTNLDLVESGPIKLRGNGKATWGQFGIKIVFERKNDNCYYKANQVTGSNTATPASQPLEVTFEHKLTLNKAKENAAGCPKYVEMTLFFNETEAPEAPGGSSAVYEHTTP
jgi:hypothetical protein